MKTSYFILIMLTILAIPAMFAQESTRYTNNQTHTFKSALQAYQNLAKQSPKLCHLQSVGSSDYGIPIPLFILNKSGIFNKEEYLSKNVLLINNAIHPGEPCGVDASIKLAEELLKTPYLIPENVIIAIIPIYNIGGAHNRNCCSRANQDGPEEYGFRGNAKNLDLNRDFIKADSKNTWAFYKIFHLLKPAIFIDTHTSNGADYQHTMTLITSQLDKMNPELAHYTSSKLNPFLFSVMEKENYPMVPYMHTVDGIPDNGIKDYLETPRYSTGYTNLFNTISYVTEAHMLKPYKERVKATYLFLKHMIEYMAKNEKEIKQVRETAIRNLIKQSELPLNWKFDPEQHDSIQLLGYTAAYKPSAVTGMDRLYYDRKQPFTKAIKYFNKYEKQDMVTVPNYYIIPQAWDVIIDHFLANNVTIYRLKGTRELDVEGYEILSYKTKKSAYEGHYLHYNMEVKKNHKSMTYRQGDYVIPVKNENIRFIIETLEPKASDSYFAWNYFDAILQQKEWFSAYVFEDEAEQMLLDNPVLKTELEDMKKSDSTFASSAFQQLYFLYKKSPHYERHNENYPITRYHSSIDLDLLEEL